MFFIVGTIYFILSVFFMLGSYYWVYYNNAFYMYESVLFYVSLLFFALAVIFHLLAFLKRKPKGWCYHELKGISLSRIAYYQLVSMISRNLDNRQHSQQTEDISGWYL